MKKISVWMITVFMLLLACTASAEFPVTVRDQAGRTVTVEKRPERIVSGYYISTSACIALGLEDRMAAVEAKADKRSIYRLAAPEMMELPSVGTAKAFDLEACLAVQPDLVILPGRLKDAAETLEAFGVATLLVRPESGELLDGMIELIAAATGTDAIGAQLLAFCDAQISALEKSLEGAVPVSALMLGNSDYMTCAPSDMYQHTVLAAAGARNAAGEMTGGDFAVLSYEQMLALNPQALIIPAEAAYTAEDVLGDSELAALDAVKNGAVYEMPRSFEAWDSPVPSGVLGSLYLASVLHPQRYSRETYTAAAVQMYETFYGFTPDEAAL